MAYNGNGGTHNSNPAAVHFGRQVRKARLERGWTVRELAARTGMNPGTLSRIENGIYPPTEANAQKFDTVFPDRKNWFSEFHRDSREWTPPGFRRWSEYENPAGHIAAWSPGIVHGLLQVEGYARALLTVEPDAPPEVVDRRLTGRMERQRRVLSREPPPVARFVVDHAALYRCVGSPEVMAAQTDHLLYVASMPHVTLQLMPQIEHPANASELIIADGAAYVEHLAGGHVYTEPEMVAPLERIMTTMQAECYRASESQARIEEARKRWTRLAGEKAPTQGRTEVRVSRSATVPPRSS